MYCGLSVCMYVTKINLVNFVKIGSYNFFGTWHNEMRHQYVWNGEGAMLIDAKLAQKLDTLLSFS